MKKKLFNRIVGEEIYLAPAIKVGEEDNGMPVLEQSPQSKRIKMKLAQGFFWDDEQMVMAVFLVSSNEKKTPSVMVDCPRKGVRGDEDISAVEVTIVEVLPEGMPVARAI